MMGSNIGIAIITEISTHSSGFGWNHFRIWRRNATHLTIWEIWLAVRANLGSYLDYTMNIHCNQGLFGLHRLNWNPDTPQIQNKSLPWQKLKMLHHNKCIGYPKKEREKLITNWTVVAPIWHTSLARSPHFDFCCFPQFSPIVIPM